MLIPLREPFVYLLSIILILVTLSSAAIHCMPGYGTTLRTRDCERAIAKSPSSDLDQGLFSAHSPNVNFRIPYTRASDDGACHFGVSFNDSGTRLVCTTWFNIRITVDAVLHTCVNREDGFGWGGWATVGPGHQLKVSLWEE